MNKEVNPQDLEKLETGEPLTLPHLKRDRHCPTRRDQSPGRAESVSGVDVVVETQRRHGREHGVRIEKTEAHRVIRRSLVRFEKVAGVVDYRRDPPVAIGPFRMGATADADDLGVDVDRRDVVEPVPQRGRHVVSGSRASML